MEVEQKSYQTVVVGRWNRHSSVYPQARKLWRLRSHENPNIPWTRDFKEVQEQVTRLLLEQLEEVDIDFVGDGAFRWDSIYDLTRRVKGCSGFQSLTRIIPGTNHFHRQPIANLPLSHEAPILVDDLKFAQTYTRKPIAMSLPGPYSAARQTENVDKVGLSALAIAYAEVFNQEARDLLDGGASLIRIEEPQILRNPEDWELFQEAMEHLTSGLDRSRLVLATWFGPITDPRFFHLPFGMFLVDFIRGRESVKVLEDFPSDKKLMAGIIDAQHPYEESDEELSKLIDTITHYVPGNRVLLSTNTDLHFLPWNEALKKAIHLTEFARKYRTSERSAVISKDIPPRKVFPEFKLEDLATPSLDFSFLPRYPFMSSTVGSFPQSLAQAARADLRREVLDQKGYFKIIDELTKKWSDYQQSLGITVPVSGEFLRDDMAAYFGRQWGGQEGDFVPSFENRRYHPIIYSDQLRVGEPLTIKDYLFLQSLWRDRLVKHTLTGPATMADWALLKHPDYYHNPDKFRMDLSQAIRAEIEALVNSGARIIQLDEPALTTKMEELDLDLHAIFETIKGFEDSTYLVLHLCYSDMASLDEALPKILRLPFHQIHMEMANRGYSLLQLIEKYGFRGKDIGLGVVDVHNDRIETVEEIVEGVRKAREYFRPEQIWLTPDCGLKERSEEVALAKLQVMCQAAEVCRTQLI